MESAKVYIEHRLADGSTSWMTRNAFESFEDADKLIATLRSDNDERIENGQLNVEFRLIQEVTSRWVVG